MKVWIIRSYSFQDNESYYEVFKDRQSAILGLQEMFDREDKETMTEVEIEKMIAGEIFVDGYDTIEIKEVEVKEDGY